MIFAYFTLLVALVISAVAEFYSIVGLTSIFSAAFWPIVIMGAALGVGKITAAVWLKLNWERASWTYKVYLVPAVAFLMVLTSMGIFGFLSKAHSDQTLASGDSQAKVAIYDEKIKTAKDNIDANRKALKQMDEAVDQVMGRSADEKGADKAVAIRRGQQKERARLQSEIQTEQKTISSLSEEAAPLRAEFRKVEAEVGPIKYIAALIYGDNPDANILEKAVRFVIIMIVAVFDPLALVLILAAQQSFRWAKEEKETTPPVDEQIAAAPAASTDAEPIAQNVLDEPQTTEPTSILERHPYLTKPFNHFVNLQPMVHKPEVNEDQAAMNIVPPEEIAEVELRPFTEEEIAVLDAEPEYTGPMKEVIEEHIDPNTRIKTFNHIWVPDLSAQADNAKAANADFGAQFPETASKGDVYLRVDYLPSKLFKFNGIKWIELDKNTTDSYAYNKEYVKFLIDKINSGEYTVDDLSDTEQMQIKEYLENQ